VGLVTFKPHDYQKEALAHLYKERRAALWMPMGGGKTVTTLTALEALSVVEDVYPVLVLAPLRVARSTWPDEVKKWPHLAHLRVSVITGTPKQRQAALDTPADIYTTNYDNLVWLRETLGEAWPFITVVADEFTRLKSFRLRQGGSRARALGQVAHTHVTRFIGLTGTPAPNGVKDLSGRCTRMSMAVGRRCTMPSWRRWTASLRRPTARPSWWPTISNTTWPGYASATLKAGCWTLTLIRSGSGTGGKLNYYSLTLHRQAMV
jgi:superfamily II DNA or RNA helicase